MRRSTLAIALFGLTLALAGCGSGSGSTDQASTTPPAASESLSPADIVDGAGGDLTASPEPTTGDITMPAAFGTPVMVGDWEVSVDSIDTDATAKAKAYVDQEYGGDQTYFVAPTNDFVAVKITATYQGSDPSETLTALSPMFYGSDKQVYGEVSAAQVPGQYTEMPGIQPGGTQSALWVFDVPLSAAQGGYVSVQTTFGGDEVPETFWTADGKAPQ